MVHLSFTPWRVIIHLAIQWSDARDRSLLQIGPGLWTIYKL
jgi:hypothetical protein